MGCTLHLVGRLNVLTGRAPSFQHGSQYLVSRILDRKFPSQRLSSSYQRNYATSSSNAGSATQALPKLMQPSFWRFVIPKRLRGSYNPGSPKTMKSSERKAWNPATFYIVMSLLIGSQAIQSLALHKDFDTFSRQTETRLELLREVVRRLQAGEVVDVEKMLGTGVETEEKAWEDMLKELEDEDELFRLRVKKKRAKRLAEHDTSGGTSGGTSGESN